RLASVLWRHWNARSRLSEGQRYLEHVLAKSEGLPRALRVKIQQGAGRLALLLHQYQRAQGYFRAALELCREGADRTGEAAALLSLGETDLRQGKFSAAVQ